MRFLLRLAFLAGLVVLGSYVAMDRPREVYGKLYDDISCKISDRFCKPVVAKSVLPTVAVFVVNKALAVREGRQVAIMAEEWPFCDDETGDVYAVPKGFETDFASIPGWAHFYVKPSDRNVVGGAIAHDWLYAVGGEPKDEAKKRADNIFRRELKNAGVNIVKRNVMYQAVSRFGGKTFGTSEEMRLRDYKTGELTIGTVPAMPVIDNLGKDCPGFLEKYWSPRQDDHGLGYGLNPQIILQWIDF